MDNEAFEERVRAGEYFHSLRLLPGIWPIIRVDGRGFSRFTQEHYTKPFDERFHDLMVQTATKLLEELSGLYAYTESDEISILFRPEWDLFDREVEKIVSISAGIASATFTQAAGQLAVFDSRCWLGVDTNQVVDYFLWRQSDATRCALNGWCYWTLRQDGLSARAATHALEGQTTAAKNELLFNHAINFNEVPTWQRRGVGLHWETYEKEGFDPKHNMTVTATRRRITVQRELPMKDDYALLLREMLGDAAVHFDR